MKAQAIRLAAASLLGVASLTASAAVIATDSGFLALPKTDQSTAADVAAVWAAAHSGQAPINGAADLLLHHLASAPTYSGTMDFGSRLANIYDGLMVSSVVSGGLLYNSENSACFSPGGSLVFHLDGQYNLARIDSYTAYWVNRGGQKYDVSVSSNGGSTWTLLSNVNYDNGSAAVSAVRGVSLTASDGGALATEVNALKFTFYNPAQGAGEAVYSELAVYGLSPVPEPSQWAAITFGVLALVWGIKRRVAPVQA